MLCPTSSPRPPTATKLAKGSPSRVHACNVPKVLRRDITNHARLASLHEGIP